MKRQIYKIKDVSSTNYSALGVEDVKLFVDETNDITGGAVDSVNGQTGVVVLDSDDISEGATNLLTPILTAL